MPSIPASGPLSPENHFRSNPATTPRVSYEVTKVAAKAPRYSIPTRPS